MSVTGIVRFLWQSIRSIWYLIFAAIIYVVGVMGVLAISGQSVSNYLSSVTLYIGLSATVIANVVLRHWPKQTFKYLGKSVSIIALSIGIALILLAQNTLLWKALPWDIGVFGAGVSVFALGMSFLVLFWGIPTEQRARKIRANNTGSGVVLDIIQINNQKHPLITVSLLASIILLVVFGLLQIYLPSVLNLDIKWIVVAATPLVLALVIGGYVTAIKGFGLALEMRIGEPVGSLELQAKEVFASSDGIRKQTVEVLRRIDSNRKRKIGRLQFITRYPDYYEQDAIQQYLNDLPNLEYFEVIEPAGTFVCLLPVRIFRDQDGDFHNYRYHSLGEFIESLEEDFTVSKYSRDAITATVKAEQSIIEVLEILRIHSMELAAVLNSRGDVLGIITVSDIEKRIASEVLLETKRKRK